MELQHFTQIPKKQILKREKTQINLKIRNSTKLEILPI